MSTSSAASLAAAMLSATTTAIGSPTWRALSAGSGNWVVAIGGKPQVRACTSGGAESAGIVRDRPEPVGDIVGADQHCERTGCGECCSLVDRDEARVRVWRAHEHRVRHSAQCDVVGKAASADQQPEIFLAPHRLPDTRSAYRRPHPFLPSWPLTAHRYCACPHVTSRLHGRETGHGSSTWTRIPSAFQYRFRGRLPAVA